jgi:hypothetical protein
MGSAALDAWPAAAAGPAVTQNTPELGCRLGAGAFKSPTASVDTALEMVPASIAVAPETWMRGSRRTRLSAAFAAGWSIAFAAMFAATLFAPDHGAQASVGAYVVLGVFFLGVASVGLLFAHRLATAGLMMRSDAVVVRNPLRTVRLAPSDVDGFVPGVTPGVGNGTPCPSLRRRGGRAIGVWALGREGVIWRFGRYEQELEPLCDQLNVVLKNLQSRT